VFEILFIVIFFIISNYKDELWEFLIIVYYKKTNKRIISELEERHLKSYCSYYNQLNENDQIIFKYRLRRLKSSIKFIFRSFDGQKKEKMIAILANQVKLTFGLQCYKIKAFERIIVYPTEYKSYYNNEMHIGETNPGLGTIVMSWRDVYDGIKITSDNLNVALHELTHALYFTMSYNYDDCDSHFISTYKKIMAYTGKYRQKMIDDGLIRAYAFSNKHETLPVLVEHFFENPEELKQNYPKLFKLLVKLLKQNPLVEDE